MTTATKKVRILLVDDHQLIRDGLKSRLASETDWVVCGEAEMQSDAMRLIREIRPDVVIVDLSLKDGSGLQLIKQISALINPPKILVCSMHDEKMYAQRAIQAGALGFLNKQQASVKIVFAIQKVLEGKIFVSDALAETVLHRMIRTPTEAEQNPVLQLTDRELQVFEAIGRGMSIREIASMMFLSNKTIETYRDRTKRKLGARSATELMFWAVKWSTENSSG